LYLGFFLGSFLFQQLLLFMRFCSYILVLYWTIITYWRIYQALWHLLYFSFMSFYRHWMGVRLLKILVSRYRLSLYKFISNMILAFLRRVDLPVSSMVFISMRLISVGITLRLYIRLYFFIFKFPHTLLLLSSLSSLKTSCNIKLKKENYLQSWLNKILYVNK